MKKNPLVLLLLIFFLFIFTGCNYNNENNIENNQENSSATKLSTTIENSENNVATNTINEQQTPSEEELSVYTSRVLDKSANRVNNLQVACNTLNNHIVNSGETFSFENLIGKTTEEKGYKKAKILNSSTHKAFLGYGGGICQVSSTLFNAVEPCNVEIIERHPHSKKIHYVPEGRDAAVSHGSYDFKFKNNNDYPLKIYASADKNNVTIRIVKLNNF